MYWIESKNIRESGGRLSCFLQVSFENEILAENW
jgi:hypothetical protein